MAVTVSTSDFAEFLTKSEFLVHRFLQCYMPIGAITSSALLMPKA
jgi:hypothetical protein